MITKKIRGAEPIHPGEILLEEFLEQYDPPISQVDAADRMHIPKVRLNQLIRGNRGVTPDTALRLADLTGTSAEFWMNLQCRYDLWHAQQARVGRKESKIRSLARHHGADQGARV
jgi:addiction module HigA family antidote